MTYPKLILNLFLHIILDQRPFECPDCLKKYKGRSGLNQHLKYECGKQPEFQCHLCSTKTKRPHSLRRHLLHIHNIVPVD